MTSNGLTFVKRATVFYRLLKEGAYPNAQVLARETGCSRNTAQRTIYRLRDEYFVPLEYDQVKKGYYLTDESYEFPGFLPPGKDELTALLLARNLVDSIEAKDLSENLDALWNKFLLSKSSIKLELFPLNDVFSADLTVVAKLADQGILQYVSAAKSGESVKIVYKSPWKHTEEKEYLGRIERVHFSDGCLYLLFRRDDGAFRTLNCSFIRKFQILDQDITIDCGGDAVKETNWLQGFGIWADEDIEEVEIRIAPPASEYYAEQIWHDDQQDEWDGDILVRRIKSMLSPEIERRILSLGRYVCGINPPALRERVLTQAKELIRNLEG